jgi:hypothetical protein
MKELFAKLVITVALTSTMGASAHAAKYDIYVNCQNGSYLMGSPTPNPGGSYGNSICASNNAGNLVSITMAQKLGSKTLCIQKAKKIDRIKVNPIGTGVGSSTITDPVKIEEE